MRKITLLAFLILASSCGVKQAEKNLNAGNYDSAISAAVSGLRNNKDKKGKQDYVVLLEDAYAKAKERDLQEIALLAKDANPRNLEKIFEAYRRLHNRQEQIKPLLPLKIITENRNARFVLDDYSDQLVSSKNALSKYLYDNSKALLNTSDKPSIRRAYEDLVYLEQIHPGFKDVHQLIDRAHAKGSDYVIVSMQNETNIRIPLQLEKELLDFSTYGLDDKWTVYHGNRVNGIDYDYGVLVNFRTITVSPEKIHPTQFEKEKEVNFGKKRKLDRRGQPVLDSLGNYIMVDDIRIVRAKVTEFRQFKAAKVVAKVDYVNYSTKQLLQSYPIASEFIFENIYAKVKGDKRALDENYLPFLTRGPMPFPTSEQMVYDTGEDIKQKLKTILSRNPVKR